MITDAQDATSAPLADSGRPAGRAKERAALILVAIAAAVPWLKVNGFLVAAPLIVASGLLALALPRFGSRPATCRDLSRVDIGCGLVCLGVVFNFLAFRNPLALPVGLVGLGLAVLVTHSSYASAQLLGPEALGRLGIQLAPLPWMIVLIPPLLAGKNPLSMLINAIATGDGIAIQRFFSTAIGYVPSPFSLDRESSNIRHSLADISLISLALSSLAGSSRSRSAAMAASLALLILTLSRAPLAAVALVGVGVIFNLVAVGRTTSAARRDRLLVITGTVTLVLSPAFGVVANRIRGADTASYDNRATFALNGLRGAISSMPFGGAKDPSVGYLSPVGSHVVFIDVALFAGILGVVGICVLLVGFLKFSWSWTHSRAIGGQTLCLAVLSAFVVVRSITSGFFFYDAPCWLSIGLFCAVKQLPRKAAGGLSGSVKA